MESRKLTEDQLVVFDKVVNDRENVFFTGCAGTGKSFLLTSIISKLQEIMDTSQFVSVTASTGRAAFNISGTTLHSFAGIGLGKEGKEDLLKKLNFNKKVVHRWKSTEVLIIDEVSMITGTLFNKLEYIARKIRKTDKPFGGIQLVLTGDFLQLPPVDDSDEEVERIFESSAWKECIKYTTCLHTVMRQTDYEFIKFLTCIRLGSVDDESMKLIGSLSTEKKYTDVSDVVNLYATKSRADTYNSTKLAELEAEKITYIATDQYIRSSYRSSNLLNNCPVPKEITLCVGAQVMLVKNISNTLVNGTVGIVVRMLDLGNEDAIQRPSSEKTPIVKFTLNSGRTITKFIGQEVWESKLPDGTKQASRQQIPLILAWAVTIHKSQGQTIQRVKADLTDVFESGQVYTALSRVVSPDTLEVVGFDPLKVRVDSRALEYCIANNLY